MKPPRIVALDPAHTIGLAPTGFTPKTNEWSNDVRLLAWPQAAAMSLGQPERVDASGLAFWGIKQFNESLKDDHPLNDWSLIAAPRLIQDEGDFRNALAKNCAWFVKPSSTELLHASEARTLMGLPQGCLTCEADATRDGLYCGPCHTKHGHPANVMCPDCPGWQPRVSTSEADEKGAKHDD